MPLHHLEGLSESVAVGQPFPVVAAVGLYPLVEALPVEVSGPASPVESYLTVAAMCLSAVADFHQVAPSQAVLQPEVVHSPVG